MKRNNILRLGIVVFLLIWAGFQIWRPTDANLIDYFSEHLEKSDTNTTAIINLARKLEKDNPRRNYSNLLEATGTNDLHQYFPSFNVGDAPDPNKAILSQLQRGAAGRVKLGIDLQGGVSFL